jgi:FkbM family methyltransferase
MSYQDAINHYKELGDRFYNEIFVDEVYKAGKEGKVFLDVGSLDGMFGLYVYPHAEVIYAIEPWPDFYKELEDNVKTYALDKIKPFHMAFTDHDGLVTIYGETESRGNPSIVHNLDKTAHEVPARTVNSFLLANNIEHIDVMKLDVESADNLIFGSDDFKTAAKKIDCIVGENHGDDARLLTECGYSFESLPNNCFIARK